jgi:hypothetical protein
VLNKEGFNELQDWIDNFDAFWKTKLRSLEASLDKKANK